jgi:hypothetical protein
VREPALARFAIGALLLVSGCREAITGFGRGAPARAGADELFAALIERHTNPVRSPKYEYSRLRLTRSALSPSRAFDDSAAWTVSSGPVRLLESMGSFGDGSYLLSSRRNVPAPARPGDARHLTTLSRLSDDEYRWDATVDFAIGTVRPGDVASVLSRLIGSGEGRTERDLRADLSASAPRTSAALGTLFSLDTLRPTTLPDGSTAMTVGIAMHSDQLRPRYPALAEYLRKYVDPARYRLLVTDRAGVPFLEIVGKDRFLAIRVRTQHGHLVPLAGPARPIPDSLLVEVDFKVKIKIFHVGFHDLRLELVNGARGDQERDWSLTARKEPQWNLPFITARLLRAPLRRPFSGEGSLFRIGVYANEGSAQTVLVRQSRLPVQESAILNFLNALSSTAMDDFGGTVQKDEGAWLREVFVGMRDDARAVLAEP